VGLLRSGLRGRVTGVLALLLTVGFATANLNVFAQDAPSWSGILESRGPYSAVFRVSPASGDLVGHLFRNASPVGRQILAGCLSGMPCVLEDVKLRPFDGGQGSALGFSDQPSGWLEITGVGAARVGSAIDDYRSEVVTRFGVMAADRDRLTLLWQGKPLWPSGSGSFSIVRHYSSWRQGELLLVQNTGGSACPALYHFIEVSPQGAVASQEFGTCSDLVYPFVKNDASGKPEIVVRMVAYVGPFGTEAQRREAAHTRIEYVFNGKHLTRNGQRIVSDVSEGALR
jgi:hypothetical protein